MRTLIVEDDFTSRLLLQEILQHYGECHVAVTGREAVTAVDMAIAEKRPYDLICLDIMLPEMDGQAALKAIRALEVENGLDCGRGARVVMTTALGDSGNIMSAFREQCDAYLVKPIERAALRERLAQLGLVGQAEA